MRRPRTPGGCSTRRRRTQRTLTMRLKAAVTVTAIAAGAALASVPAALGLSASATGGVAADAPPGVNTPPGDAFKNDPCATFVGYPHRCGPLLDPGPQ